MATLRWLLLVAPFLATGKILPPERRIANNASKNLRIAGSSTVLPVAQAWSTASVGAEYASIMVESGGSSSGARRVCHPEGHPDKVDIGDMSRDWKSSEALLLDDGYTYECLASGIRVTQIAVGVDGLALIVARNSIAYDCLTGKDVGGLTLAMLRWMFSDWTDDQLVEAGVDITSVAINDNHNGVKEWSDLHASCAQAPIHTYGPGDQSGTYDFFGEVVFCKNCFGRKDGYVPESFRYCPSDQFQEENGHRVHMMESMNATELTAHVAPGGGRTSNCYIPSENDSLIVEWILADSSGIGFVGYAHYSSETERLISVPIASDDTKGVTDTLDALVAPTTYSITDGSYNTFRRDLFMNVDNSKWDLATAFLDYGFSVAGQEQLVRETGYIRVNAARRAKMRQRIQQKGNDAADYVSIPPDTCPEGFGLSERKYLNSFGTLKTNYTCQICSPGFSKGGTAAEPCAPCEAGRYVSSAGQTHCSFCELGRFSSEQATVCEHCPANTMAELPGMTTCTNCSAGTASLTRGSSACLRCDLGTYRPDGDPGFCTSCPAGKTTAFQGAELAEDCRCAAGSYESESAEGLCVACAEGVRCPFGSVKANMQRGIMPAPQLEPSYFSFYSDPLSVYKCLGDTACPGGSPETCGEHSSGVACGRCEFGYVRVDGGCVECENIYKSRLLWPTIPLVLGPPVIYGLYCISMNDVEEWGRPLTGLAAMAYVILVNLQVIGVSGLLNVQMPDGVAMHGVKDFLGATVQLETVLRPECAINSGAFTTFLTRVMLPVFIAGVFLFTYAVMRFLPRLPVLNFWVLVNVYGGVFNTFYITIAAASLGLFQCYGHPNGKSSVRDSPDILCYEGEWNSLIGIAVMGMLLFCILPIAVIARVVYVMPKHFENNPNFRLSIKFIARKFCPQEAWWTIVLLMKGLWVNVATVFFMDGAAQILWLNVGLLMYAICTVLVMPWRHYMVSCTDIASHCLLSYVFTMEAMFLENPEDVKRNVSVAMLVVIFLDFAALSWGTGYLSYRHFFPKPVELAVDTADKIGEVFGRAAQQRDRLASLMNLLPGKEVRELVMAMKILERESNVYGAIIGRFSAQSEKFDAFHAEAPVFEVERGTSHQSSVHAEDLVYAAPAKPHFALRTTSVTTLNSKGSAQTRTSSKGSDHTRTSSGKKRHSSSGTSSAVRSESEGSNNLRTQSAVQSEGSNNLRTQSAVQSEGSNNLRTQSGGPSDSSHWRMEVDSSQQWTASPSPTSVTPRVLSETSDEDWENDDVCVEVEGLCIQMKSLVRETSSLPDAVKVSAHF